MGWLHSTPKGWTLNRHEWLTGQKRPVGLPRIEAGEYLLDIMNRPDKMGWFTMDGMGERRPHKPADIMAFGQMSGEISEAWEMQQIRTMSFAYLEGLQDGADEFSIAPTGIGNIIEDMEI